MNTLKAEKRDMTIKAKKLRSAQDDKERCGETSQDRR